MKVKSLIARDRGRIIFWGLLLLAFMAIAFRFTDLRELYLNLKESNPIFILLAIFSQVVYFALFAYTYQLAFQLVKIYHTFKHLLPLTFAYIFVNVVAPTLGASGPALFASEAARRKESTIKTLAGVLIANLIQFFTFGVILLFGVFYLYSKQDLRAYQIIAALLLVLMTGFLMSLIILGLYQKRYLLTFLQRFFSFINHLLKLFGKKKPLNTIWIKTGVTEFSETTRGLKNQPNKIVRLGLVFFLVHAANIMTLFFVFQAFNEDIRFGALVAGFVIGVLFQIIGITPYGIGLTESAMALTFTSLGVVAEKAILITLTFRGITFWLPFLIGFILLRKVQIFGLHDLSVLKIINTNKHLAGLKKAFRIAVVNIEKKD